MRRLLLLVFACLPLAAQTADPVADLLDQGYRHLRTGDRVGAIAAFEDARRLAPDRPEISRELGFALLGNGERERARQAFERAWELDPAHSATAQQLGYLRAESGDADGAREVFQRAALDESTRSAATAALAALESPSAPENPALERAYAAQRAGDLEAAADAFGEAAELAPQRPDIRQNLAYVLLRTGETLAAVRAFEEALRLNPGEDRTALELAFLRHETGEQAAALAGFRSLRDSADTGVARTAAEAADRLEAELGGSIERWEAAVRTQPDNRAARIELGDLYERRGQPALAAAEYAAAYPLPGPNPDEILLKLGRARLQAGELVEAHGAFLLASRSAETRIAETARDLLPDRTPWANEFRAALALAPSHTALRKELAYLLLAVGQSEEAVGELERVLEIDPGDLQAAAQLAFQEIEAGRPERAVELLERARGSSDPALAGKAAETLSRIQAERAGSARALGEKSLRASYLRDARLQFQKAWELRPGDPGLAYKLGVVNNLLQQDREAVRWFALASGADDPQLAAQAQQSYRNLAPQFRRVTTSVWMLPFYSKRFGTVFGYAQAKTEFRIGDLPVRPYISLRLSGDVRRRTGGASPQQLSESALIGAFGLRAPLRHGFTLWGEAGQSVSYLGERAPGTPFSAPDYRGGLNWFRARGPGLGSQETGVFQEWNVDAVYVSRFDHDALAYFRYRPGFTLPQRGPWKAQLYANWNVTIDASRQYWANYVETGPGFRLRVPGVRPPMDFSVDFVRGVHLSNRGNVRRPNYFDVRAGVWYSFSR
ncbi:MAG: tetratricopeptide repeat protein [Acidobacteria bacterium]|nr:tetratricopeptide repeat protein [Acidobacteriota bacterium]